MEPLRKGSVEEAFSVTRAGCLPAHSPRGTSGSGNQLGAGVEGDGPRGGRLCPCRGSAGGDAGLAPLFAAERDELAALLRARPGPRGALLGAHRPAAGHVPGQPDQRQIPADAHRARPELGPPFVGNVGDVLELEPDPPLGLLGQTDLDPADLTAELPCGGETVRRGAALDRAARAALQLVAATQPPAT